MQVDQGQNCRQADPVFEGFMQTHDYRIELLIA